jgi:hypothetical protein
MITRIEQRLLIFFILVLNLIVSGCGTSTQVASESISDSNTSEILIPSETPDVSVHTITPTLHPSLINCAATPMLEVNEELPDTPEAQEIIRTIQKSGEIYSEALRTSDASKFPTVFVNDPRFPVSTGTLETVGRLTNNPSLQSAGWLDYKLAYFTWQIKEGTYFQIDSLHTPDPPTVFPPDFTWCSPPPTLHFLSMNIDNDIAIVKIDEGATTYELTLVLINNHWYIAAYHGISVSP